MPDDQTIQYPFVSVIVPVYNDLRRIATCLAALLRQTYPRDRYEVLVVDNGSADGTRDAVARFPVTLLVEDQTQSSYAARNKGLAHARGTIIAFTDSDCTPAPGWLAAGVRALDAQQADLAGGNVRFVASPRPTGAEICDSMANLRVERYIREEGAAPTANLFVRAAVFAALGPFPGQVQSGGDRLFTRRATAAGFKLVYAPEAEVAHPTRRLGALLKKQFRVGKGHHAMRAAERAAAQTNGASSGQKSSGGPGHPAARRARKLYRTLKGFLPEPLAAVTRAMREHGVPLTPALVARVWGAAWLSRVATTLGSLSMFSIRKHEVPHAQRSNA